MLIVILVIFLVDVSRENDLSAASSRFWGEDGLQMSQEGLDYPSRREGRKMLCRLKASRRVQDYSMALRLHP